MQTSSVKAFMRRAGRSSVRRGNYYNLSVPSLASRGFSVSGGASAEDDVDANEEVKTTSTESDVTAIVQDDLSNSVDEDVTVRASATETLSSTEDNEIEAEVEAEAEVESEVPDVEDAEPAAIATAPVRISTNESGAVVVEEDKNLEAKLTRKEKRLEKKKRRGELKSHQKYAKKLKSRNNLNLNRKLMHAGCGFFFGGLNHIVPKHIFMPCMSVLTAGSLVMELLRYRKGFGWMNDILHFCFGSCLRKSEMDGRFTGNVYYFMGVVITAALFPRDVASMAIFQLALADPSASYFGRQTRHVYWSRIENGFFGIGRNKGLLGFLGGALFCFPFNFLALSKATYFGKTTVDGVSKVVPVAVPGGRQAIAIASIALGLAGAFADLCVPTPALTMPKKICGVGMPPFHVDDNIVVPIFSAYACTKIFASLGWTSGVELSKLIIF